MVAARTTRRRSASPSPRARALGLDATQEAAAHEHINTIYASLQQLGDAHINAGTLGVRPPDASSSLVQKQLTDLLMAMTSQQQALIAAQKRGSFSPVRYVAQMFSALTGHNALESQRAADAAASVHASWANMLEDPHIAGDIKLAIIGSQKDEIVAQRQNVGRAMAAPLLVLAIAVSVAFLYGQRSCVCPKT
uniref:Uncharacterized protein n=1 Tax=Haptolina brevifila TaxID=156173 RepID=A0A7S2DBS4_9EUKA